MSCEPDPFRWLLHGWRVLRMFVAAGLVSPWISGCEAEPPPEVAPPRKAYVADPNDKSPVRLSPGTALPEKTPAGEAMSFSVDYKVMRPLNASARSLFVIEAGGGKRSGQPTQLVGSGTLKVVVNGWQPADGPFEARIEEIKRDGTRRPLSLPVPLE